MSDEDSAIPPPEPPITGSIGEQQPSTMQTAQEVVLHRPKSDNGLIPVTTAEQLAALARSDEPSEVKRDLLVGMLVGTQQAQLADVQLRLQQLEKECVKLRKQLAEECQEAERLRGDLRVCSERISQLRAHRGRDNFLLFVASVLFGVGGAYIGRSVPTTVLGFGAGIALSDFVWSKAPAATEGRQ